MFYPYVTISAAQARESAMSPFSPCLSSFFWCAKNLGICESTKDSNGAPSKKREKKVAFVGCIWMSLRIGTAFMQRCDVIGLQMQPPKDADPELGHSICVHWFRCIANLLCCSSGSPVPSGADTHNCGHA